jgi:hypothetical protein
MIDRQAETESNPAFEIHLGESFYTDMNEALKASQSARYVIIWLNGKRWEGTIYENTVRDLEAQGGPSHSTLIQGQRVGGGSCEGDT